MSCIDKSMNSWLNKLCPGFMSLPCKPHSFGNKYHLIANGDDGKPIMWRVRIVEGNNWLRKPDGTFDFPSKWEKKRFSNTVELLLDMTVPIHHTGKVVMGNSGFCVALGSRLSTNKHFMASLINTKRFSNTVELITQER